MWQVAAGNAVMGVEMSVEKADLAERRDPDRPMVARGHAC
jgi:hypothetical protein